MGLLSDKAFVVAEIGLAHMGWVDTAEDMIEQFSCADAVKFQVYDTNELIDKTRDPVRYQRFREREFTFGDISYLKHVAKECGVEFFASAHTAGWVDKLRKLGVFAYKVGSGESADSEIIRKCRKTGKPVIISTGLRSGNEVFKLMDMYDHHNTVFMHCITQYPTYSPQLGFMRSMMEYMPRGDMRYGEVGYSCHYPGIQACVTAAAMGATVIEKHVKLDISDGQDARAALYPHEFEAMVDEIRETESIIGSNNREYSQEERGNEVWAKKGKDGKRPLS